MFCQMEGLNSGRDYVSRREKPGRIMETRKILR